MLLECEVQESSLGPVFRGSSYKIDVVHFPSSSPESGGVWIQEGQYTDSAAAFVVQMVFRVFKVMGQSMLKTATV